MLEASREPEREIAEHIRLDIQIAGIADLRGVNRGGNAAIAVGGGRLRGGNLFARGIQSGGACAGRAIIERLRSIRPGREGGRIAEQLLIVLVAPFHAARDRNRTRQSGDHPGITQVEIEVVFLLNELAVIETGGR